MRDYLRLRTFIVLGIVAVFAYAMHPLAPQDFYKVFRSVLKDDMGRLQGEKLVAEAQKLQQQKALNPAGALLEAAGLDFTKVIKTTCFLADIADFAAFNEVYAKYFISKPARSCVAVKDIPKGCLCEIEILAKVD